MPRARCGAAILLGLACGAAAAGTWRDMVHAPVSATDEVLYDTLSFASDDAWAAGYRVRDAGGDVRAHPLVLHWNGVEWRPSPSLDVAESSQRETTQGSFFTGLGGIADDDLWAVGGTYVQGRLRPLVQHFDGTRWTAVGLPPPGGDPRADVDAYLGAVAAAGASDAWAVGFHQDGRDPHGAPLVLHWDGTQWAGVDLPAVAGCRRLYGVNDVAAERDGAAYLVGSCADADGHPRAYVLAWDGALWTVLMSAEQTGVFTELSSVAVAGPGEIWAVGHRLVGDDDDAAGEPLTFRRDPAAGWVRVPPPAGSAVYGLRLNAVGAAGPNLVWAVGDIANNPSLHDGVPFAMRWNGAQWIRETVGTTGETLWGVDVRSSGRALAVGGNGRGGHSLIFTRHDP